MYPEMKADHAPGREYLTFFPSIKTQGTWCKVGESPMIPQRSVEAEGVITCINLMLMRESKGQCYLDVLRPKEIAAQPLILQTISTTPFDIDFSARAFTKMQTVCLPNLQVKAGDYIGLRVVGGPIYVAWMDGQDAEKNHMWWGLKENGEPNTPVPMISCGWNLTMQPQTVAVSEMANLSSVKELTPKLSLADDSQEKTFLDYAVKPQEFMVDAIQDLEIVFGKRNFADTVMVSRIVFTIPQGDDATNLTLNTSSIKFYEPLDWSITREDGGSFILDPKNSKSIDDLSRSFRLRGCLVNSKRGPVTIEITEESVGAKGNTITRKGTLPVAKFRNPFVLGNFWVENLMPVAPDEKLTLRWDIPKNEDGITLSLTIGEAEPISVGGNFYPPDPLTKPFTLSHSETLILRADDPGNSKPFVREAHVLVQTPELTKFLGPPRMRFGEKFELTWDAQFIDKFELYDESMIPPIQTLTGEKRASDPIEAKASANYSLYAYTIKGGVQKIVNTLPLHVMVYQTLIEQCYTPIDLDVISSPFLALIVQIRQHYTAADNLPKMALSPNSSRAYVLQYAVGPDQDARLITVDLKTKQRLGDPFILPKASTSQSGEVLSQLLLQKAPNGAARLFLSRTAAHSFYVIDVDSDFNPGAPRFHLVQTISFIEGPWGIALSADGTLYVQGVQTQDDKGQNHVYFYDSKQLNITRSMRVDFQSKLYLSDNRYLCALNSNSMFTAIGIVSTLPNANVVWFSAANDVVFQAVAIHPSGRICALTRQEGKNLVFIDPTKAAQGVALGFCPIENGALSLIFNAKGDGLFVLYPDRVSYLSTENFAVRDLANHETLPLINTTPLPTPIKVKNPLNPQASVSLAIDDKDEDYLYICVAGVGIMKLTYNSVIDVKTPSHTSSPQMLEAKEEGIVPPSRTYSLSQSFLPPPARAIALSVNPAETKVEGIGQEQPRLT